MNSTLPSWLFFSPPSLLVFLFSQLHLALAWFLIFKFSPHLCSLPYIRGGMFGHWPGLQFDTWCLPCHINPITQYHDLSFWLFLLSLHETYQQTLIAYSLSTKILEQTDIHRGTSQNVSSGYTTLECLPTLFPGVFCTLHLTQRNLSGLLPLCLGSSLLSYNHLDLFNFL